MIKKVLFNTLRLIARILAGKGLGRFDLPKHTYGFLTKRLMPEQEKIIEINGYKMYINTDVRGLDGMTASLVVRHEYEPLTTEIFKQVIKEGMNIIDVGANIGYFSLLSSKLTGKTGKVWAVEPEPNNYEQLLANIELNLMTNIIPVNKAADSNNGHADLFISREESGEHSLTRGRPHIKDTITVETVALNNLVNGNKIDFIKTDTEGNDMFVLHGANHILRSNPNIKVLTEFWLPGLEAIGSDANLFWKMLNDYGFTHIYIIDEIGKRVFLGNVNEAISACQGGKFSVNLLCLREGAKP